jgi:predicted negative regulator of RcsB-dependent stress response
MLKESIIEKEEAQWEQEKELLQRKQKIKEEKHALKNKKISTTKLIVFFLFLNCTIIEIFTGWTTIQSLNIALITGTSVDFSPLVTLIGTVVGEVIGFAVYAAKAVRENTAGGIVYDQAMNSIDLQENIYGAATENDDDEPVG